MLSSGARRLAGLYAVAPGRARGRRDHGDRGLEAALALGARGRRGERRRRPAQQALTRSRRRCGAQGIKILHGWTVAAAEGRRRLEAVRLRSSRRLRPAAHEAPCDLLVVSGGDAPAAALVSQAGGRTAYDAARGHFALAELPPVRLGRRPAGRRGRTPSRPRPPASVRASRSHARSGSATRSRSSERVATLTEQLRRRRRQGAPGAATGRPCGRAGQGVRLLLRGRHREGHPPRRRRGVRLDRAVQALHDGDDGPLPGAHVPAARRSG